MAIESLPPLRLRRRDASERTSLGWRLLWCGVALLAVGATVVSQYPAAWAAERVASATGQRVLLADPQGSIWHGSATLALTAGNGGADATVLPGRLSWSVDMLPLLTGTLRAHVAHDRALTVTLKDGTDTNALRTAARNVGLNMDTAEAPRGAEATVPGSRWTVSIAQ